MIRKSIIKGTAFIIILLLIISIINPVFIIKTKHRSKLIQGLYENPNDEYDVVLLGSSHMNGAVNPNVLWNQYGITSFNYATGGQPLDVTYYLLKEVLKKHKKPIVVVDLYYLGLTSKFGEEGYIRYVLDNMKLSKNKVEAIFNCTPRPHWLSYLFPIFKYHSRWKELKEEDFNDDISKTYYTKGFDAEHIMYGKENSADVKTTETAKLPPKTEKYLYKIIELSKKEGFKLIFINVPHDYTNTAGSKIWHNEPAKMFNRAAEISKENNITFINYCNKLDELGFDFKADMYNSGHLNIWGSNKLTTNFGEFLKENYKLEDHRNDKKYAKWNTDYVYYSQTEAATILRKERDIKNYIPLLKNKNYIIAVSLNSFGFLDNGLVVKETFNQLGLKLERLNNNDSYIGVINSGRVEEELYKDSALSEEFRFNNIDLKVTTSSSDKNIPSIIIEGKEYANKSGSLNIVVYDKVLERVIDSIYLENNNTIKRN